MKETKLSKTALTFLQTMEFKVGQRHTDKKSVQCTVLSQEDGPTDSYIIPCDKGPLTDGQTRVGLEEREQSLLSVGISKDF